MKALHLSPEAYVPARAAFLWGVCPVGHCYRVAGHEGRHAMIRDLDGQVIFVFGEDVYADLRARNRMEGCS